MSRESVAPEITLRAVDRENFHPVIDLELRESQRSFVAPNVYSIAEAWLEPTFRPLAVYASDELVGFAMYGLEESTGRWWIIRLMIDQRYQRRGYGRAATLALIRLMTERTGTRAITLSYEPENLAAAALYRSLGFVETGEIEEGEIVAQRAVQTARTGSGTTS